jgi:hypothetical protein
MSSFFVQKFFAQLLFAYNLGLQFFGKRTLAPKLLVSISPTFYEQLLRQNPFAKKIKNPNCKHIKAA